MHNAILLTLKEIEILPFATIQMALESKNLSAQVRERQIPYDFTHMWNLRNKTKQTMQMETEQKTDS